ncbi:MAG TPA: hypothetical protein PLB70_07810 [Paludibacteraceae bacterium]|nr:hypothetical protein [Paludibacteraceae bacterium]
MYRRLFFALILLLGTLASCNKDHDHETPYNAPYYNGQYYYYYNGVYYQDPDFTRPYALDPNHYYYGRVEWKGSEIGFAIVLKENPYHGLVCKPNNLYYFYPHPWDGDVMVRFSWNSQAYYNDQYMPIVNIVDIYYK